MLFVELLIVAYLIVAIVAVIMVFAAIDKKPFRIMFILIGMAMPLILLYSTFASLFTRKPVPRFNEEYGKVEDEIETERVRIFGGEQIRPSFSDHWRMMYQFHLERIVAKAARTSEKIASLGLPQGSH